MSPKTLEEIKQLVRDSKKGYKPEHQCSPRSKNVVDTLVVGQDVRMLSGCYYCQGKVTKITPEGVDVGSLRFDKEGKGRPGSSTYECGPWYILGTQPYPEVEITREPAWTQLN
jgi:hypothetical protein